MPNTARGMLKSLKKLAEHSPDKSRQREGSKATEYHISILPPVVQAALLRKSGKVKVGGMTLDLPKPQAPRYCKEQLWANWSKANDKAHAKAKDRLKAVQAVHALVANGSTLMEAYQHISDEFAIALPTLPYSSDYPDVAGILAKALGAAGEAQTAKPLVTSGGVVALFRHAAKAYGMPLQFEATGPATSRGFIVWCGPRFIGSVSSGHDDDDSLARRQSERRAHIERLGLAPALVDL